MSIGTVERPLRVAIVGAGPSGFYAAGALIGKKQPLAVEVDIFDRMPAPYGLVRYGVAPDHAKIKNVRKVFERTALDPRVQYFGHVNFGTDLSPEDLLAHYDQVVYAVGAQSDRRLHIPGEHLPRSMPATVFVGWYNGHPDYADLNPDLTGKNVAVIGVGNVAMDVARILAKSTEELAVTDIADHALEHLLTSHVERIYLFGRRGPVQAKFTNPELKEFGELEHADIIIRAEDLELDPASEAALEGHRTAGRSLELLQGFLEKGPTGKPRQIHLRFLESPVEILGDEIRGVTGLRVERNELRQLDDGYIQSYGTGEYETLDMHMVLRSVGYRGVALPGVPFEVKRGVIPNKEGRIYEPATGAPRPHEYVVGWAKRGPSGVIGTNKPDAHETVRHMLDDVAELPDHPLPPREAINGLLLERGVHFVTFDEWQRLDTLELERGEKEGRPRVKICTVNEMLERLEED